MKRVFVSIVSISILWSCSSSKSSVSNTETTITEDAKLSAVIWQQTAAEYEALCYQAFNIARYQLMNNIQDQPDGSIKKPAVVLDLDETVLNNSPYNGWLIQNKTSYSQESWERWTMQASASFIPGAVDFIDYARSNGFEVFFISNRSIEELEATVKNLNKLGIDINPTHIMLKTNSSSKVERRKKVMSNYQIVMLIGDNLADFNNQFDDGELDLEARKSLVEKNSDKFGTKFIVLPNVMYGNWEKALKMDNPASIQNNSEGLKRYIKGF